MCLGLGVLERLTGATAARKAQQRAARQAQQQANLQAQASQQQLETNIAQNAAAKKAEELLSVPIETTEVSTGTDLATASDATTGRRKATRDRFQLNTSAGSGLSIP